MTPGSGGLNACQVKGTWQCNNPPSRLRSILGSSLRDSKIFGRFLKKQSCEEFYKNPRFLLKIDGKVDEPTDLIIGLMVDPNEIDRSFSRFIGRKRKTIQCKKGEERMKNQFAGGHLWIYPTSDENPHLQSDDVVNYCEIVPKLEFTKDEMGCNSIEHVERVTLTPGSYVLVPSIKTNLPKLEFLIRVFSENEGVSLSAL